MSSKLNNRIFFFSFMLIWLVFIILNFVVPNISFSEQENRALATVPDFTFQKLVDGVYVSQMDDYINDHFVFRNNWIKAKSTFERALGKDENNNVYIGKDGYLFEKKLLSKEDYKNIDKAVASINSLKQKINTKTYFMLLPNAMNLYSDKLPDYATTYDQNEVMDYVYNLLNKDITKIDTRTVLNKNKEEYLYFKTDHHMTSLGALLSYNEFREKTLAKKLNEMDYVKIRVARDFLGTLDSKAQIQNQEEDKIDVYFNESNINIESVYYDGKLSNTLFNEDYLTKKDKYSYFLNANNAEVIINTKNKNGKKLLVIKDSYAHIMSPFMCADYEQIVLLDPRYYKASISNYINKNNFSEVLFIYNVANILSDISIRGIT
ncbi:MAG: DHHW family protein [Clostridia bacterium]|nr:DHHW family protein [Clostridia bacterium]